MQDLDRGLSAPTRDDTGPGTRGRARIVAHVGMRVVGALLVSLIFVSGIFLAVHVWGDPIALLTPRDPKIPGEIRFENCIRFGLCGPDGTPLPLPTRYVLFLDNLRRGEFGVSYYWQGAVADLLREAIPATVELLLAATLVALAVGFLLATLARRYRHRGADAASRLSGAVLAGLPIVWFAIVLQLLSQAFLPVVSRLGVEAPPFVTGLYTIDALLAGRFETFVNALQHLALPALALGLPMSGFAARALRRYSERALAGPSLATSSTFPVGAFLGGAMLVETVVTWKGVGWMLFASSVVTDLPAVLGSAIVLGLLGIVLAAALSILEVVLEPTRFLAAVPVDVGAAPPATGSRVAAARRGLLIAAAFVGIVLVAIGLGMFLEPPIVLGVLLALLLGLGALAGWLESRRPSGVDRTRAARRTPEEVASRTGRAYRRFGAVSSGFAWAGFVVLVALLGMAALAPILSPYDPFAETLARFEPPNAAHWLGTDDQGRDVLSRVLWGARGTLLPVGIALLVPAGLGYAAGLGLRTARRGPSILAGLLLDPIRGLPEILLVAVFLAGLFFLGRDAALPQRTLYWILVGTIFTPAFVRSLRNRLASRGGSARVARPAHADRRVLNAVFPGLLAVLASEIVLVQAAISFVLGGPLVLDWASDLARAHAASSVLNGAWWLLVPPGLMILLLAFAFLLLAEGLSGRDETRAWRPPPLPAPRRVPPRPARVPAATSLEAPAKTAPRR